jgi:hypothetical protein
MIEAAPIHLSALLCEIVGADALARSETKPPLTVEGGANGQVSVTALLMTVGLSLIQFVG